MNANNIPVIAIDGPSASGKGTVAQLVSENLGFQYFGTEWEFNLFSFGS